MPLLRCAALIAFGACLLVTSPARANSPLRLPSGEIFELLIDILKEPAGDPLWQCAAQEDELCPCVELSKRDGELILVDVVRQAQELHAAQFSLHLDGTAFHGQNLIVAIAADGAVSLTFDEGIWQFGSSAQGLSIRAVISDRSSEMEIESTVEELTWFTGAIDEPPSCGDAPITDTEEGITSRKILATAERAQFADSRWAVDDFRVSGPGRLRTKIGTLEESPSGFLAPLLRVHREGAQLMGSYYFGRPSLSLRAFADLDGVGGVGIAHWTRTGLCTNEPCPAQSLGLHLFAGLEGLAAAELVGDAFYGTPRRHASLSSDGASWAFSEYRPSHANAVERGVFFQSWRAQRLGLSASGPNHDLYLGGRVFSDSPSGLDLAPGPPEAADFWIHYGTRVDLGGGARAQVRLNHRELRVESFQGRVSDFAVGVDRVFGSVHRVFWRPSIQGELEMGVLDHAAGARAGSSGYIDLMAEAGLGLRGQPAGQTHNLAPRIFAGRRVVATDGLPAGINRSVIDSRSLRSGPQNFLGSLIEQRLSLGDAWLLRGPVGVLVMDNGAGAQWEAFGFASASLSQTRGRRIRIGVDGICRGICEDWGLTARMQIAWTRWLDSLHFIGRGIEEQRNLPVFEHRFRGGIAQQFSTIHSSRIRIHVQRWSTEMGVFGGLTDEFAPGGELRLGHHWSELGWGVVAHIAALPHQQEWSAMLGLSTRVNNSIAF